jgi:hypothetical protein
MKERVDVFDIGKKVLLSCAARGSGVCMAGVQRGFDMILQEKRVCRVRRIGM